MFVSKIIIVAKDGYVAFANRKWYWLGYVYVDSTILTAVVSLNTAIRRSVYGNFMPSKRFVLYWEYSIRTSNTIQGPVDKS